MKSKLFACMWNDWSIRFWRFQFVNVNSDNNNNNNKANDMHNTWTLELSTWTYIRNFRFSWFSLFFIPHSFLYLRYTSRQNIVMQLHAKMFIQWMNVSVSCVVCFFAIFFCFFFAVFRTVRQQKSREREMERERKVRNWMKSAACEEGEACESSVRWWWWWDT